MSKEEIRSRWRESCMYDGNVNTFEDSPPATKKAKYQPGRRSPDSTHVLLQLIFVVRLIKPSVPAWAWSEYYTRKYTIFRILTAIL